MTAATPAAASAATATPASTLVVVLVIAAPVRLSRAWATSLPATSADETGSVLGETAFAEPVGDYTSSEVARRRRRRRCRGWVVGCWCGWVRTGRNRPGLLYFRPCHVARQGHRVSVADGRTGRGRIRRGRGQRPDQVVWPGGGRGRRRPAYRAGGGVRAPRAEWGR